MRLSGNSWVSRPSLPPERAMKFSCDSCGASYMISDEKVGPNGVRVR